jgi:hypothetical protein
MRHLISFTKPCSNFSHCHKFLNCFSYQVFVGARLHVSGGVLRGGRVIDAEASVAGNGDGELILAGFAPLDFDLSNCCGIFFSRSA